MVEFFVFDLAILAKLNLFRQKKNTLNF